MKSLKYYCYRLKRKIKLLANIRNKLTKLELYSKGIEGVNLLIIHQSTKEIKVVINLTKMLNLN